jgi:hypothetical protein
MSSGDFTGTEEGDSNLKNRKSEAQMETTLPSNSTGKTKVQRTLRKATKY